MDLHIIPLQISLSVQHVFTEKVYASRRGVFPIIVYVAVERAADEKVYPESTHDPD
jgi:hypothetical protein